MYACIEAWAVIIQHQTIAAFSMAQKEISDPNLNFLLHIVTFSKECCWLVDLTFLPVVRMNISLGEGI